MTLSLLESPVPYRQGAEACWSVSCSLGCWASLALPCIRSFSASTATIASAETGIVSSTAQVSLKSHRALCPILQKFSILVTIVICNSLRLQLETISTREASIAARMSAAILMVTYLQTSSCLRRTPKLRPMAPLRALHSINRYCR